MAPKRRRECDPRRPGGRLPPVLPRRIDRVGRRARMSTELQQHSRDDRRP